MTGSDRLSPVRRYRLVATLALFAAAVVAALLGPSIVTPSHSSVALASTSPSCNLSGCAAARAAYNGWDQFAKTYNRGVWPTDRAWKNWKDNSATPWHFSGGQYYNDEGDLPAGATYNEYDVTGYQYSGHKRDALRIVVNLKSGAAWYTPDHYSNFYKIH